MTNFINALNDFIWGPPLIILMLVTGVYFTVGSKFFQIRYFKYIMKQTLGKIFSKDKEEDELEDGVLSPFEAIATAIGGSVGFGNIAGVATAIAMGGPGATVWMWITAFLGMILKQVEVTLAVYYRRKDEKGDPYGGPTYYMERGLGEERNFKLWKVLATVFGFGIFSTFFITASNYTVSEVVASTFKINQVAASLIIVVCTYLMIWKGMKYLGKLFTKLIPIMSVSYLILGIVIIALNYQNIPESFKLIFEGAFNGSAAVGGFVGATISKVISTGMARSVYSNEAGWGTSPMVHASSKTRHPVEQGLWGSLEVFVDTFVVCTVTSLVVIITGEWSSGAESATLTLNAFTVGLGTFGTYFLTITMLVFGLTTSSGWYVYYEVVLRHLCSKNIKLKNFVLKIFKYFYPLPGFLMTMYILYVGEISIWTFVDITSGIPTFINVAVVLALSKQYFVLLKDYKARYLGVGEVDESVAIFYEDKKGVINE
ncbi:alanine/glycine:cation symporter family protein [Faecalimicrobium dakarense]|uniref:alanine/glycine:cation symporter family protein n=1 Tax=Faecalimicrobium dakarense TaxID=1301100 RepID=UPI0004B9F40A|nr:sodium:alanine symporter family protein [[Clostridium] dakarense]